MVGVLRDGTHNCRHCQKERREAKEARALSSAQGKESDRLSLDQLVLGSRYCNLDYPALVSSGSHPPPAENPRSRSSSSRRDRLSLHSGHLGIPDSGSFRACR